MSQGKENIEAKLAEYIEGTLDEAGRAEIERHLAANPEHRRLMTDLAETRNILRNLPRQSAPEDLTDILQGQLERAVLLDDGFDGGASLRIRRWPQVIAVAAILLLAVGLGVVVYVTLPPEHPSGFTIIEREVPGEVGIAPPQAAELVEETDQDEQPATPPAIARVSGNELATTNGPATAAPADAVPQRATAVSADHRLPFAGLMLPRKLGFGIELPGNDVVVVMAEEDPWDADEGVVALFRQQNLNWEPIVQPNAPETTARLRTAPVQPESLPDIAQQEREVRDDDAPVEPFERNVAPLEAARQLALAENDAQPPAAQSAGAPKGYVVRDVTPQQAEQLLQLLSQAEYGRMNRVYRWNETDSLLNKTAAVDSAEDAADMAFGPAQPLGLQQAESNVQPFARAPVDDQPIIPDETIVIEIDELVGPGVTPQTEQTVDETGHVKLQMILDPVRAEGRRLAELEKIIADRYREANLIDEPTVRVRRAGVVTQPGEQRLDLVIVLQNRATSPAKPTSVSPVTPQDDAPLTAPADSPTTLPAPAND